MNALHRGARRALSALPLFALLLLTGLSGRLAACACGCQIFDLGLSDMPTTYYPNRVTLQYSFMDQNENQSGSQLTNPGLNPDKQLESSFYDLSYSRQFNMDWGASVDLPFIQRLFTTDMNGTPDQFDPDPDVRTQNYFGLGDARVQGMYTGFSEDMALGITFGLKLPTGQFTSNSPDWIMDRDTAPGTGSTDLLLGAFDRGQFDPAWGWFAQTMLDAPLYERDGYEAANNLDLDAGVHFDGFVRATGLTPLLQANVTIRGHDSGGDDSLVVEDGYANYNSGYENLYLTPGLMEAIGPHVQATELVYLPVTRNVNGDQLVASWLVSGSLSYLF